MSVSTVLEGLRQKFGEQHLQTSTDDYLRDLACDLLVDFCQAAMREVAPEGLIAAGDLDITDSEATRLAELLDTATINLEASWS